MAYTDASAWSPKLTPYGGLTQKQVDMSTARNPMNDNAQNEVLPEKEAAPKPEQKPTPVDKQYAEQTKAETQRLQSKIGSAAYRVQGLVNKFLKQGTEQAKIKTEAKIEYDPTTKMYVSKNTTPAEADLSAAVEEKAGQLASVKEAAKPFYTQDPVTGKWKARTLKDVAREQLSYSELAPQDKARVDNLIGMAQTINKFENTGKGDSAEAQAVRQQLEQADKNGIMSGMYKAMKEYQDFVEGKSFKWFGDEGSEGVGIQDLLSMDLDAIKNELQKAITTGSGKFGGEYESGLKRQIDTESKEAQLATKQEVEFRNKLAAASVNYFQSKKDDLYKNADIIKKSFDAAAPEIMERLQSENTPSAQSALQFFTSLSESDSKDFATIIGNLLYDPDSGLGVDERKSITEMLGKTFSGDKESTGKIDDWISELAATGKIAYTDDQGFKHAIELNGEEKFKLLQDLDAGRLDEIQTDLETKFRQYDVGKAIEDTINLSKNAENITAAVGGFTNAMINSLKTYATSKTEDAYRMALKKSPEEWAAMSDADKVALMKANPDITADMVKSASGTLQKEFDQIDTNLRKDFDAQVEKIDKEIIPALNNLKTQTYAKADTLKAQVSNYIVNTVMSSRGDSEAKYNKYFTEHATQLRALGYDETTMLKAANLLSTRDALLNFKKMNPKMFNGLYLEPVIQNFLNSDPNTALTYALRDSGNKDYLRQNIDGRFDIWTYGSKNFNADGALDTLINSNKDPKTAAVPEIANAWKAITDTIGEIDAEIAKANENKTDMLAKRKVLDNLKSQLAGKVFSPQQIADTALQIGKEIEDRVAQTTQFLDLGAGYKPVTTEDIAKQETEGLNLATKQFSTNFSPLLDFQGLALGTANQETTDAALNQLAGLGQSELDRLADEAKKKAEATGPTMGTQITNAVKDWANNPQIPDEVKETVLPIVTLSIPGKGMQIEPTFENIPNKIASTVYDKMAEKIPFLKNDTVKKAVMATIYPESTLVDIQNATFDYIARNAPIPISEGTLNDWKTLTSVTTSPTRLADLAYMATTDPVEFTKMISFPMGNVTADINKLLYNIATDNKSEVKFQDIPQVSNASVFQTTHAAKPKVTEGVSAVSNVADRIKYLQANWSADMFKDIDSIMASGKDLSAAQARINEIPDEAVKQHYQGLLNQRVSEIIEQQNYQTSLYNDAKSIIDSGNNFADAQARIDQITDPAKKQELQNILATRKASQGSINIGNAVSNINKITPKKSKTPKGGAF